MSGQTLLVMAGGTGGHIFPALAVAERLRDQGWKVVWMGNPEGMEGRLVPARHFPLAGVSFGGLRGKGLLRKLALPFNLARALGQALGAIKEVRPNVVLGMGGYITFPGGVAARLRGVPLVIHEQNSVAGMANKALASWATRVLSGFPKVIAGGEWVGNPVRPEIAALADPATRYAERQGPLQILVVGGSLGAKALNDAVPQALSLLPPERRPQVVHQAGEKHIEALKAAYAQVGVSGHCVAFIDDMAGAYAWADLVICRAGALTVAELAAAGVASLLVPYPHAVDDHQTGNARFLSEQGAARLLPQGELGAESLASLLASLDRTQLAAMAAKARELAKTDATARVAQVCAEVAK